MEMLGEIDSSSPKPRSQDFHAAASSSSRVEPASRSCADAKASIPPRPPSEDEDDRGNLDLSRSPLFSTKWGRVILDEAHRIKGRINSTAQASFALRASTARWCLSGTPIQNRVAEFLLSDSFFTI